MAQLACEINVEGRGIKSDLSACQEEEKLYGIQRIKYVHSQAGAMCL